MTEVIRYEHVDISYKGKRVVHDVSLSVEKGEIHALLGENGAGKTTLVNLSCGLIEPVSGRILYDGVDIRKYNRNQYYGLFGAVFQDYSILPVTIEEIVAESVDEKVET